MDSLLAKWIYPHFHNDHRPYATRHQSLFAFVVLLSVVQIFANTLSGDLKILGFATNISQPEIINLTNKEREKEGLASVQQSLLLSKAAELKAQDMFKDNYWAHFSPDGTSPWYFFNSVGYQYSWAGENLARDFQTSSGVVGGWMASTAGHRENILNSNFTEIGVAVKNGVLLGEETTLVVQLFARPINYSASSLGTTPKQGSSEAGSEAKVEDRLTLPKGKSVSSVEGKEFATTGIVGGDKQPSVGRVSSLIENLSTSQKTSFGLLLVLGSLFAIDSATLFRRRHARANSHSGMHTGVIFILMVTILAQSVGSIL